MPHPAKDRWDDHGTPLAEHGPCPGCGSTTEVGSHFDTAWCCACGWKGALQPAQRITEAVVAPGAWVTWGSSFGVVESVHTGPVPGARGPAVGTSAAPAARVRLHVPSRGAWAATEVCLAIPCSAVSTTAPLPIATGEAVVAGSFEDIRRKVRDAIKARIGALAGVDVYVWVVDIGSDWVVYEGSESCLYMSPYKVTAAGVELGVPVEVYQLTTYVTKTEPAAATESVDGRILASVGSDQGGGRIFRTQIIAVGASKNGRNYGRPVLEAAAGLYEGTRAYDHHRTDQEIATGTVAGLVGVYRNVAMGEHGLEADLHLLPSASHIGEMLDESLVNQAAGLAPLVGISHDVSALPGPVDPVTKLRDVAQIVAVNSADVVAVPAAGGRATRMVASLGGDTPNPATLHKEIHVNLKQLLALLRAATPAQRPTLLTEHAQFIEGLGMTADDVLALAVPVTESAPPPAAPVAPAPAAPVTESAAPVQTIARTSTMGRLLVSTAVAAAKLPDALVESVLGELPEAFTEAELETKVQAYARISEGLEKAGMRPSVPDVKVTGDERAKKIAAVDAMLAGNYREGYRSVKQAFVDVTGRSPRAFDEDFSRTIMQETIGAVLYDSARRATESLDSTSWAQILGDSITRRMVAEYSQPSLQSWRMVVNIGPPIADFRTQRITRMGGYGTLPTVLEGAPYQALTSAGDEEATYALAKKGGTEDYTLEMVANDDLRALQAIPRKLGQAASQTIYRHVWDQFAISVPTCTYDSVALFHASHANTTSTALSSTALEVSRKNMRKQAGYGDTANILSLAPKFLITVPDLEALAFELCTSAVAIPSGAPVGAASNIPNLHQGMTPVIIDYWSATTTTAWFLAADPAMCPTIEVGFYQGREDPELFTQSDPTVGSAFSADKVTWKVRHIYGSAPVDHRGLSRGNS